MLYSEKYSFCKEQYAISVCRIEPENNIHIILSVLSRQSKVRLVIIGNWKQSRYGKVLLRQYAHFAHIYLLDPIYDLEQINILRSNAFFYIHGHSAGGTNPSLVEAMSIGLPIFAYDCTYNRYTTENQCQYWSNPDGLYGLINNIDFDSLKDLGLRMKSIADRRYRWESIAKKYEFLFCEMLGANKEIYS
jgi:glycosyltransferase involved in cell wall biosynthesis